MFLFKTTIYSRALIDIILKTVRFCTVMSWNPDARKIVVGALLFHPKTIKLSLKERSSLPFNVQSFHFGSKKVVMSKKKSSLSIEYKFSTFVL